MAHPSHISLRTHSEHP